MAVITGEEPSSAVAPVHLAGPAEFLGTLGLTVLAQLVVQGVRLRVATGLTESLLEELRAGRHDLVVATRRPRGRTLHAELLGDEEFVLVAAPVWAERLKGQELPTALLAATEADGGNAFAGYRLTGFSNAEEIQSGLAEGAKWLLQDRLVEIGADYQEGEPWAPNVVVDRNLVTGQNPASAGPAAAEMLKKLA
ncbi:LysR substrate-binding domain-containing protein [Streptomyces sp. NPDC006356]